MMIVIIVQMPHELVATADQSQVRPTLQKPTRPFLCVASLERGAW